MDSERVPVARNSSRAVAQQLPGINEVVVAEIDGRLVGMLHLSCLEVAVG